MMGNIGSLVVQGLIRYVESNPKVLDQLIEAIVQYAIAAIQTAHAASKTAN